MNKIKIVTIGGGTGGSIIDQALAKEFPNLTSVVTSFDNGGSSGLLRKEFGILPFGDIRRRIFAQKKIQNEILEVLYNFRFDKNNSLETHSMGNLLILSATKIWGEKEGIKKICELFKIQGKVLPITFDYADLAARLESGRTIFGEDLVGQTNIDKRLDNRKIEKVYLTRETKINEEVAKEIISADYLILCPGDFYGSLICNFLVKGFKEAILKSRAEIIYFPNIMTKKAETHNFKLSDFLKTLENYLPKKIDFVIYNNKFPSQKLLSKYFKSEKAELVINDLKNYDSRILEMPLLKENGNIRHDTKLILNAFKKTLEIDKKKIQKEKLHIFDLDDTLAHSTLFYEEVKVGNLINYKLFKEAEKLLIKLKKQNCILLTFDKYGVQNKKIQKLNLKKYFRKIYIVKKVEDKHKIIELLTKQNKNKIITIIGDRHDAELAAAKKFGLRTICVALDGNRYIDKNKHPKYDFIIEKKKDFLKILTI